MIGKTNGGDQAFPALYDQSHAQDFLLVEGSTKRELFAAMAVGLGWWSLPKLFVSASVGYEAKRVFVFGHRGCSFPYAEFREAVDPHLASERSRWSDRGETLEGAGCWSPLFPARMDDMMLAAAACAKVLEELASEESVNARLSVFEQSDTSTFTGFKRVAPIGGVTP